MVGDVQKQYTISQSDTHGRAVWLMYLVSVESWQGNLQMVNKVVVTKGKYKNYWNEIRQSYELGFTPCRLHTNVDGIYILPPFVFMMGVYVLDDVATMEIGGCQIEMDEISSKLIYFVGDCCSARR